MKRLHGKTQARHVDTLTDDQLLLRAAWFEVPAEDDTRVAAVVRAHPDGLMQKEVAELMGISRQALQKTESIALRKLREMIQTSAPLARTDEPVPTVRRRSGKWGQRDTLQWDMQERLEVG